MSKRNKLIIFVVILLAFALMMIFYNYKDASKLPTVTVKYNNESIVLKPSTYDYENKTSIFSINRKQSKDNTLNLKPSSSVNIIFNEEPHEYNLSIEEDKNNSSNVKFKERNQFLTEKKEGIFKYSLKTISYDKGFLEYVFYINLK